MSLEFWARLWFYIYFVFILHLWSQCPNHLEAIWLISNANQLIGFYKIRLISNANQLIGFYKIWTLWSKCIAPTLYMFYLFYLLIYLLYVIFTFVYSYYQFYCLQLLMLLLLIHFLIHSIVAALVLLSILLFLSVISTLLFMLPLFIRTLFFIFYHYFVFISVLVYFINSLCFRFKLFSSLSLWFRISSFCLAANSISSAAPYPATLFVQPQSSSGPCVYGCNGTSGCMDTMCIWM